jgi:peptidoglycan hydrolase-like protein with peptidoglycan-binding domain
MIGKLQTDVIRSVGITEEQPQLEKVPVVSERPQNSSTLVQESKLGNARKNESMFSTSMQRAMLDSALITKPGTETPAPVGTPAPEVGAEKSAPAGATETGGEGVHHFIGYGNLKLNDQGPEVERLQDDLNKWRAMNNLPPIAASGTFTTETEDAVKAFQRATNLKETGTVEDSTGLRLNVEMSPEFQELNANVKEKFSAAYSAIQNDPKARENLLDLIDEKPFLYLVGPEAQEAAINGLMVNPGDKNVADSVKHYLTDAAILENDPNYDNLPQEIKEKAMNTMFYRIGLKGGVGGSGRHNDISGLAADPSFGKRSLEEQRQLLDIVSENEDGPVGINSTSHTLNRMINDPSFQNLPAEMQTQVIDIMNNNVHLAAMSGNWPKDDNVRRMENLLQSPAFINASEEEKRAKLEAERQRIYIGDR